MAEENYVKKPCKNCPFRRDVRPFLHPERAYEIAVSAGNPYNEFPCHKTLERDEEGELSIGPKSKTCAGFLTMQIGHHGERAMREGFEPDNENVYADHWEMSEAYEEQWEKDRRRTSE